MFENLIGKIVGVRGTHDFKWKVMAVTFNEISDSLKLYCACTAGVPGQENIGDTNVFYFAQVSLHPDSVNQ